MLSLMPHEILYFLQQSLSQLSHYLQMYFLHLYHHVTALFLLALNLIFQLFHVACLCSVSEQKYSFYRDLIVKQNMFFLLWDSLLHPIPNCHLYLRFPLLRMYMENSSFLHTWLTCQVPLRTSLFHFPMQLEPCTLQFFP